MPLPTDDVAMKPETTFRPASEPAADAPEAAAEHAHAHVRRGPSARLPTEHGDFTISSYFDRSTGIEHMAIHCGELAGARDGVGQLPRGHGDAHAALDDGRVLGHGEPFAREPCLNLR